jgi:acetyltransferase
VTIRNLDALFAPSAIALIGASNEQGSVGAVLARNLLGGGFSGPILPVNPHERAIGSTLAYPSVASLPIVPDLAVIATPAASVPGIITELGALGCRAAAIVSAGFGPPEAPLRQALLDAARPHLMRIVGPNGLGFLSPVAGINASFAQLTPARGDVAFITQSGAIATTMLDWAAGQGIGFSHVVSIGDMADVDFGDLLDHLALDPATKSILLYVESITSPRKFMSAARIAARAKPVVVVKGGRSRAGARAAKSHTGALAGSDAVYDAAFRRAGMLRVYELRALFEAAGTLASGIRPRGDRLTILTNGGGLGVLAADALDAAGGRLAILSEATRAAVDKALPRGWSGGQPVDILGDADAGRYEAALKAVLGEPEQDAILVVNCPTGVVDGVGAAEAVARIASHAPVPVLSAWAGEATAAKARHLLSLAGTPAYETPDEAVSAFMQLVEYRRNQEALRRTPPASALISDDAVASARTVIAAVLAEGRDILTEAEAKAVLAAFGIPIVPTVTVNDADGAAREAGKIEGPVALKILSRDITHKSDVGGVRLDLPDARAVRTAAEEMLAGVAAAAPGARIGGFTVQPMVRRPKAQELIAGIAEDTTFGPVILFGAGGVAVEVLADRAIGLPPLDTLLAKDMIARTRVSRLLAGYRDRAPVDVGAVADVLVRLSEIAARLPEVAELDINPLLADDHGVVVLDARIVVRSPPPDAQRRFAIRPYPAELAAQAHLRDGTVVGLRPVRPEDERGLAELIGDLTEDDRRLRFMATLASAPTELAVRLSQIDYDREMTLLAIGAKDAVLGASRLICDPEFETAEFSVMVRSNLKGKGAGYALMKSLIDYAKGRGLARLVGHVSLSNTAMLELARDLGAHISGSPGGAEAREVTFELQPIRSYYPVGTRPKFRSQPSSLACIRRNREAGHAGASIDGSGTVHQHRAQVGGRPRHPCGRRAEPAGLLHGVRP